MYPPELTAPMRAELTGNGVDDLTTPDAVEGCVGSDGTALVFVNSVCGCAAGGARPGLVAALKDSGVRPDRVGTVFAGVDREAVDKARELMLGFPPSSPSAALFKDGEVVWMIHRHQIEGSYPEQIAQAFGEAFKEHCA
ncbi:MAG: BrxA/BrxB family bacilliredoxin [Planctomycetota bacterium]|jgi:putative YphP/YqiW family bacilliredoxin|nr:BrxA/BrxB family bacilliredoxin [Planctomycetota bacterium]